ncbi:hypothetical protein F5Y04DRAFT_244778 [Hypomontagnella monticulosa]|nr:hypothetical protein F5Y04DRAFT_244778 [Hypomontagnella monticulosa]
MLGTYLQHLRYLHFAYMCSRCNTYKLGKPGTCTTTVVILMLLIRRPTFPGRIFELHFLLIFIYFFASSNPVCRYEEKRTNSAYFLSYPDRG